MTTSEPTSEIVKEITNQSTTHDIIVVLKMIVRYLESFTMDKMSRDVMSAAADRLESQDRTIADLTARAEKAEAERDAAKAYMQDNCQYCVGYEREADEPPCSTCYNARTFEPNDVQRTKNWKWRGLQPQDGEGK